MSSYKRYSKPHGGTDTHYVPVVLSEKARDNFDKIFGKKDFVAKKLAAPKQSHVQTPK